MKENIMLERVYARICELSDIESESLLDRSVKLHEESGEVAAAVLKVVGKKPSGGKSDGALKQDVLEEVSDTMIAALSVVGRLGFGVDQVLDMMETKCGKWEFIIGKRTSTEAHEYFNKQG